MWFTPSTRYTFSRKNPTTEREKDMANFFDFEEIHNVMHPGCRICGKAIFAADACKGHGEPDPDHQVKAMKEDALTD